MSYLRKWYGFGKDPDFDAAVRSYEAGDLEDAILAMRRVMGKASEIALRDRAKSYLAGALGRLGRRAMEASDWRGAVQFLGDAVALRPRYADLHLALARVHAELGELDTALLETEIAVTINARYGQAMLVEGAVLMQRGDHMNGLARAVQAAAVDRRLETAEFREAIRLADEDNWGAAAELLLAIQPVPRSDLEAHATKAEAAMRDQDWPSAENAFRTAREVAPTYADLASGHGQALLGLGRAVEAEQAFRDAIAINPLYAEGHALLGVALRSIGREDEAKDAFRAALALNPADPIARTELERGPS